MEQTVVRFGIPPTDKRPAICQFALAFRSDGKRPVPPDVKASHDEILKEIRESKKLSEELEDTLENAVNEFKKGFATTDGSSVVPDEKVEAMDEQDVEKESVKVNKPAPKKK